jgi:hypothetical protein
VSRHDFTHTIHPVFIPSTPNTCSDTGGAVIFIRKSVEGFPTHSNASLKKLIITSKSRLSFDDLERLEDVLLRTNVLPQLKHMHTLYIGDFITSPSLKSIGKALLPLMPCDVHALSLTCSNDSGLFSNGTPTYVTRLPPNFALTSLTLFRSGHAFLETLQVVSQTFPNLRELYVREGHVGDTVKEHVPTHVLQSLTELARLEVFDVIPLEVCSTGLKLMLESCAMLRHVSVFDVVIPKQMEQVQYVQYVQYVRRERQGVTNSGVFNLTSLHISVLRSEAWSDFWLPVTLRLPRLTHLNIDQVVVIYERKDDVIEMMKGIAPWTNRGMRRGGDDEEGGGVIRLTLHYHDFHWEQEDIIYDIYEQDGVTGIDQAQEVRSCLAPLTGSPFSSSITEIWLDLSVLTRPTLAELAHSFPHLNCIFLDCSRRTYPDTLLAAVMTWPCIRRVKILKLDFSSLVTPSEAYSVLLPTLSYCLVCGRSMEVMLAKMVDEYKYPHFLEAAVCNMSDIWIRVRDMWSEHTSRERRTTSVQLV